MKKGFLVLALAAVFALSSSAVSASALLTPGVAVELSGEGDPVKKADDGKKKTKKTTKNKSSDCGAKKETKSGCCGEKTETKTTKTGGGC